MSPFRVGQLGSLDDSDSNRRRNEHNAACEVTSGDCYLRFPWYFPVSEVLRQNVFIPAPCYSSSDVRGQDLQLIMSTAPFTGAGGDDAAVSSSVGGGVGKKLRMVRIVLYGPSHMNLIIRDNSGGSRVKRWSLGGDDSMVLKEEEEEEAAPTAAAAVDHHHHHRTITVVSLEVSADDDRLVRVLKTPSGGTPVPGHRHRIETVHLHEPPPVRAEGIHFLQIGFGLCHQHHHYHHHKQQQQQHDMCSTVLHMLVEGDDPLDVAAYGHYIDVPLTDELQLLQQTLPDWAKGAEWTNFPSHLIRDTV